MKTNFKHWIVYMYTFPNNKKYIGKTCRSLVSRQGLGFKRYQNCTLLWNAIQKYGYQAIKQEILFEKDTTAKEACDVEMYYIEFYKTNSNKYNNPTYGYNLTAGGDGLSEWTPSPERYKKLCEQLKQQEDKKLKAIKSEVVRNKMRLAKLGKKRPSMTEETKRKISFANSKENMSEATRIRRSESKKKKVLVTNNATGEKVIYHSLEEVCEQFSVRCSSVTRWCKKIRNPSVNFTFDYYIPPTTTEREDLLLEDATV